MSQISPTNHQITKPYQLPKGLLFKNPVDYLQDSIAEDCRRSFYFFIKEFWEEVSPDEPVWNWHIPYLCEQLSSLARNVAETKPKKHDLFINIPPGETKSIVCTIMFPVWCWINWHWMRFITGSYSSDLSLEHAEYSRDLIRSDKFQKLFPDLHIKHDKDAKGNFRIEKNIYDKEGIIIRTELGGNRYSTSVGGTIMGFHGHIIIVDDPLNPKKAASEKELKTANHWMDQTLSTRKVNKEVTPMVLVMQRLHQDDPTGHILQKKGKKIFHICLPGEIKNYREEVKPPILIKYYKKNLLNPTRLSLKALKELEADLGQYGFAGQIGQRPTPPGGGMFKVDHFQIVDQAKEGKRIIRYWDKAGTKDGGTFTVGVKMTRLPNGKYLVLDVKRGQWSSNEREDIILETAQADGRNTTIWVEQEPGSGGKESAEATIRNLAGFICYKECPSGDKEYRADPFSVQVNNGNVLLLRGEWNKPFIEEHRFFPFSVYKDQVDAAAGSFNKLAKTRIAGPVKNEN
jgi:predicted phage terminase large subunit-like protein